MAIEYIGLYTISIYSPQRSKYSLQSRDIGIEILPCHGRQTLARY